MFHHATRTQGPDGLLMQDVKLNEVKELWDTRAERRIGLKSNIKQRLWTKTGIRRQKVSASFTPVIPAKKGLAGTAPLG